MTDCLSHNRQHFTLGHTWWCWLPPSRQVIVVIFTHLAQTAAAEALLSIAKPSSLFSFKGSLINLQTWCVFFFVLASCYLNNFKLKARGYGRWDKAFQLLSNCKTLYPPRFKGRSATKLSLQYILLPDCLSEKVPLKWVPAQLSSWERHSEARYERNAALLLMFSFSKLNSGLTSIAKWTRDQFGTADWNVFQVKLWCKAREQQAEISQEASRPGSWSSKIERRVSTAILLLRWKLSWSEAFQNSAHQMRAISSNPWL